MTLVQCRLRVTRPVIRVSWYEHWQNSSIGSLLPNTVIDYGLQSCWDMEACLLFRSFLFVETKEPSLWPQLPTTRPIANVSMYGPWAAFFLPSLSIFKSMGMLPMVGSNE